MAATFWAYGVLALVVFRFCLEVWIRCFLKDIKRHAYEFKSQAKLWFWCFCYLLNLAMFLIHVILLGILFEVNENSANYWMYSMFVYYLLQCYLAVLVSRQDREDERAAKLVIYASAGALLLAFAGLLYSDFCDAVSAPCNDYYYNNLWPAQFVALVLFLIVDCLLWARGTVHANCTDACDGYQLQLQKSTVRIPSYARPEAGIGQRLPAEPATDAV